MLVYKYVKPDGDDIIKNLRIKVSNVLDFNDPFEFLPSIKEITADDVLSHLVHNEDYLSYAHKLAIEEGRTNETYELFVERIQSPGRSEKLIEKLKKDLARVLRETIERTRGETSKTALFACFCGESVETHNEILMWSHYTDGHKGLRIAFDRDLLNIQGSAFLEINYEPNRLQYNPVEYWQGGIETIGNFYRKVLRTKSSAWAYEREHRWLVSPRICQKDDKILSVGIKPEAIVEVACGARCSEERLAFIKNLVRDKFGDKVKVKRAVIDDYEFRLNYVEC
jgi:hypothetical protein